MWPPAWPPCGPESTVPTLWTVNLPAAAAGLALAAEPGAVLAWTGPTLMLWNARGVLQGRASPAGRVTAAAAAADGSCFASADDAGRLTLLGPDLAVRWATQLPAPTTAVAIDGHGWLVAAADRLGGLAGFDREGRTAFRTAAARPLAHLVQPPAVPVLIGAAEFGLVAGFDLRRNDWAWRDAPVAHAGSLAAAGDGDLVLLACFTGGLMAYDGKGARRPLPFRVPAKAAAVSYDGRRLVTVGLDGAVTGLDRTGGKRFELPATPPAVAVAVSPFGERVWAARSDGSLICEDVSGAGRSGRG
jgi:hypothetical protein